MQILPHKTMNNISRHSCFRAELFQQDQNPATLPSVAYAEFDLAVSIVHPGHKSDSPES
jgi:hypothetical protein